MAFWFKACRDFLDLIGNLIRNFRKCEGFISQDWVSAVNNLILMVIKYFLMPTNLDVLFDKTKELVL